MLPCSLKAGNTTDRVGVEAMRPRDLSPDRKQNRAPSWPKVFAIGVSKVDRRRKADYFDDPEVPAFSFFFFDDFAELSEVSELAESAELADFSDFSDLDDSSREPFFA